MMESAVQRGESLAHPGREQFTREDARTVLMSWRSWFNT